ncbi:excisionase [Nesterenkonia sp. PF2B19]|nr:excisionase [Nesterenkonia sp. PF2B19]
MVTAVAGTVLIALGAFWLSFTALADLARRSGIEEGQAWAWPLIVDGIIVVATVSVVALAGQRGAWYPWALLAAGAIVSVTANALHAVVAADADVPGVLAASVAAVPPLVLLAITHLTVILTRPVPEHEDPQPLAQNADETRSQVEQESLRPVASRGRVTVEQARTVPGPRRVEQDRRDVAAELRGQGWSNKRIAGHLGVHPSTVGRWFTTAHLPDIDTVEEAKNP